MVLFIIIRAESITVEDAQQPKLVEFCFENNGAPTRPLLYGLDGYSFSLIFILDLFAAAEQFR